MDTTAPADIAATRQRERRADVLPSAEASKCWTDPSPVVAVQLSLRNAVSRDNGVNLNHATLTLTNGVAAVAYGASGLTITGAGNSRGEGTPALLNRVIRHSAVPEQALPAWAHDTSCTLVKDAAAGPSAGEVRLRFTECVVPVAGGAGFPAGSASRRMSPSVKGCPLRTWPPLRADVFCD